MFASIPGAGVLALSMQTVDEHGARIWYARLHTAGVEGLMIKPARSRYEPGMQGWLKLNSVGVRARYRESSLRVRRSSGLAA
ncbi:hypothetical protein ACFLIM_46895 [Nonomuraea sp. M3C6]|uniref:ATP-dependent DNA ligase family profile domain-containing protein n=1 Tax=Nonomuraea marmarensis TaxID=3351344 RepID=A0ABW7ATI2_9ACTN